MQIMKIEPGICSYVDESDNCYYIMDYHSGKGFKHSNENQLILNFKKRKNENGQQHKTVAIGKIADILINIFNDTDPNKIIFIPIPPSKISTDPLYDDRMLKVLDLVERELTIPYVNILSRPANIIPLHENQTPRIPSNHNFNVDQYDLSKVLNRKVIIIDDVITTGSTYKAAKDAITKYVTNSIIGLFIARAQ